MNIGFDLDGIFINKPPFVPKQIIEWLYRGHDHSFFYRIPPKPEQLLRKLTHQTIFRPLIEENMRFLRDKSIKNTNTYYLISGRFGFLKEETQHILRVYGIDEFFDKMFFNYKNKQPHIFKNEMIKKLNIHYYVDDDLPLLEFLSRENKEAKFYWFNDKEAKRLKENLFAITDLSDILT